MVCKEIGMYVWLANHVGYLVFILVARFDAVGAQYVVPRRREISTYIQTQRFKLL
jgi:hypothetical protein